MTEQNVDNLITALMFVAIAWAFARKWKNTP